MQILQSSKKETNRARAEASSDPLADFAEDLERLNAEILALYREALPPAIIHQIAGGAREQAGIGHLMLDDCIMRAESGCLNATHIANGRKWVASVRAWIEGRKTKYASNVRRKLYVVKAR